MPIAVVCSGCGKQYKVADAAAGKRLKCRECGRDMLVPMPRPVSGPPMPLEEDDPLEALARMESSAAASPPPPPMTRRGPLIPQRPATLPPGDPLELVEEPQHRKEKRHRLPGRFGRSTGGGVGTDSITPWLVIAFVVAQLAAAIVQSVQASHVPPGPAHGKIMGMVWVAAIVHIVLLFALLGPAVYLGAWVSSLLLNYRMIDLGYLRGCAIAAVPALLLLAITFVPASAATPAMLGTVLTIGLLVLIPVTFLLLRRVFDLDWVGGAVAYLLAAPLYFGATVVGGILVATALAQAFGADYGKPVGYFERDQFARVPQDVQRTEPATHSETPTNPPPAPPPSMTTEIKKTQTAENLRQIGQAAQQFAGKNDKHAFPPTLEALTASGDLPSACLNSPFNSAGQAGGYYYYPARSADMPAQVAIAYDAAELAAGSGTHVLFANGSVDWRDAAQFESMVTLSNQSLADWEQQQREAEQRRQQQMASATSNPSGGQPLPSPEPPKPAGFVGKFDALKTPFVATVAAVPIDGEPREIVRPATTSPLAAVVRSAGDAQDTVELWDLAAGQKKQETMFAHDAGFQASYALNPGGTLLARTVNFPKLAVRIWSLKDSKEGRLILLDERLGTPTLAGFLDAERLAVRWNRGPDEGLEIWNAYTGTRARAVPFAAYTRSADNGVFSADGHEYALTTGQVRPIRPRGALVDAPLVAHMELYDLSTNGTRRWRDVPEISAAQADAPAGMAFSPDGHKVAALFARNGAGFLIIWRVADARAIGQYEVALAPSLGGDAPAEAAQTGLVWVHNGSALLVGGNTLVDANSGKTLGQLNAPPSNGQWLLGGAGDDLAFGYSDDGKLRVAHVKLDAAKFGGSPTTATAPMPGVPASR